MKILAYTFRTFPEIERLKDIFPNVFIFGKLKQDLKLFKEEILKEKPDLILGIAIIKKESQIESKTVNKFNNYSISKNGCESYELFIPDNLSDFNINKGTTTSFCNWTMYKISELVNENNFNTNLSFVHLNSSDIAKLKVLKKPL